MAGSNKSGTAAVAEPEDDLLPGGPEPDPTVTDNDALARLTSVEPPSSDAFVDDDAESDDEIGGERVERFVTTADDAGREPDVDTYEKINLGYAQLQDVKVSAARNGNNYDATYEIDLTHLDKLPRALRGGHDITWKKIAVGQGAELRRAGITRDADGGLHLKVSVHLPESEIGRSLGRLGPHVRTKGELILEPMQGTLKMPGGKEVDLTARA